MINKIKDKFIKLFKKDKASGFYTYCDYEKEIVSRVLDIKDIKYKGNK